MQFLPSFFSITLFFFFIAILSFVHISSIFIPSGCLAPVVSCLMVAQPSGVIQ